MAFRSEGEASAWERERDRARGATVPVEVLGELSRRWYGGRMDDEWRPSPPGEKQAILREAGLRGEFWELG